MNPGSLTVTSSTIQPGATPAETRLKPAAHEFEACLLGELLKPLTQDSLFGSGDEGAGEDHGSNLTLMSFGSQALAKAISERGGLGIASRVIEQFEHRNGSAAPRVGNLENAGNETPEITKVRSNRADELKEGSAYGHP